MDKRTKKKRQKCPEKEVNTFQLAKWGLCIVLILICMNVCVPTTVKYRTETDRGREREGVSNVYWTVAGGLLQAVTGYHNELALLLGISSCLFSAWDSLPEASTLLTFLPFCTWACFLSSFFVFFHSFFSDNLCLFLFQWTFVFLFSAKPVNNFIHALKATLQRRWFFLTGGSGSLVT